MAHSNEQTPVARRERFTSGYLPPRQTPLMRALRDAMRYTVRDSITLARERQSWYNAGSPDRSCPTDRLAILVDDAIDAVQANTSIDVATKREQLLALPRTLEAHILARLAPAPVLSVKEHALRVSRTDAAEDMTLAEHLANPGDPSIALRAAEMAEHEAREKLTWATAIRAFFLRTTHRGSAA